MFKTFTEKTLKGEEKSNDSLANAKNTGTEEIKAYLESRIEYIRKNRGKETVGEKELQRVLDLVNEQLAAAE